MVVSLLFLALAFFAVGQAGATRNGAQSAADAAALAAAKDSRDGFLLDGLGVDGWEDLFEGELTGEDGCAAGGRYAAMNGASIAGEGCVMLGDGRWGFRVTVRSVKPVGDTILPGTEGQHAIATATAVVEPRCAFDPPDPAEAPDPTETTGPGDPGESPAPGDPSDGAGDTDQDAPALGSITCDGTRLDLDPEDLPDMSDLFEVRLTED